MKLSVDYLPAYKLNEIEQDWKELETGNEMTLFQSFEWNKMLLDYYVPKDTKKYCSLYAIVRIDGSACMIAPLWIIKKKFKFLNKKGIYFIGRDSYSDYLNFIYKVFNSEALDFLIMDICNKFKQNKFILEQLNENTSSFKHIIGSYRIIDRKKEPCVNLHLPIDNEDYQKYLSKHARQNLRTANNRITKDHLSIVYVFDNTMVDPKTCLEIRESKLSVQYDKVSQLRKYKYRLVNRFRFHFPSFYPISDFSGSKIMTATINDELCAFFNYAYDEPRKKIVIISAGTNLKYARYSPGILLIYNYIMQIIMEKNYTDIDFTRGNESYKYTLGGKTNYNFSIRFSI